MQEVDVVQLYVDAHKARDKSLEQGSDIILDRGQLGQKAETSTKSRSIIPQTSTKPCRNNMRLIDDHDAHSSTVSLKKLCITTGKVTNTLQRASSRGAPKLDQNHFRHMGLLLLPLSRRYSFRGLSNSIRFSNPS